MGSGHWLKALSQLPSGLRGLIAGIAVILCVGGALAIQFGGVTGATLLAVFVLLSLAVFAWLLTRLSAPQRPAGEGWAWGSKHPSLTRMKDVLDHVIGAREGAHTLSDLQGLWVALSAQLWEVETWGHYAAVVHQFEVLADHHQVELARNVAERKVDIPLKFCGKDLLGFVETRLRSGEMSQELRVALERLKGLLEQIPEDK